MESFLDENFPTKGTLTKNVQACVLHIRITEEEKRRLQELATADSRTVSGLIKFWIHEKWKKKTTKEEE